MCISSSSSRAYINPTTTPLLEEPVVMVLSNTTFALYKIPKCRPDKMLSFRSRLHDLTDTRARSTPPMPIFFIHSNVHLHALAHSMCVCLPRDRPKFHLFVERSLKALWVHNPTKLTTLVRVDIEETHTPSIVRFFVSTNQLSLAEFRLASTIAPNACAQTRPPNM